MQINSLLTKSVTWLTAVDFTLFYFILLRDFYVHFYWLLPVIYYRTDYVTNMV